MQAFRELRSADSEAEREAPARDGVQRGAAIARVAALRPQIPSTAEPSRRLRVHRQLGERGRDPGPGRGRYKAS